MKCWTQYLPAPEKKFMMYCNYCGAKVPGEVIKFKMNIGEVGAYCTECWDYEFPDGNSDRRGEKMKPNYDCNGRPLNLDDAINGISFP